MKKTVITALMGLMIIIGCAGSKGGRMISFENIPNGDFLDKPLAVAKIFNSPDEFQTFQMARALRRPAVIESFDYSGGSLLIVFPAIGDKDGLEITRIEDGDLLSVYAKRTGEPKTNYLKIEKTNKKAQLIIE